MKLVRTRLRSRLNEACKDKARPIPRIWKGGGGGGGGFLVSDGRLFPAT